jgi:hypothetical protein
MSETEDRLAALCAAAGYDDEVRGLIAHATFPCQERGRALSDRRLRELADGVKLLVQAGRAAEQIPALIAAYQARHGEQWREAFWRRALRTAAFRAAHPEPHEIRPGERPDAPQPPSTAAPPEAADARRRGA